MNIMQSIVDYIMSLGSNVFVPIVLIIVGLVFGLGFFRAVKQV